jgi:hypothetical protein
MWHVREILEMPTTLSENLSEKKVFGVSGRSLEDNMKVVMKEMEVGWIKVT